MNEQTEQTITSAAPAPLSLEQAAKLASGIAQEVSKAMIGQQNVVRETLIALLAGGHVLIEGVPGLGKTLLVRALAKTVDGQFSRIQFTRI